MGLNIYTSEQMLCSSSRLVKSVLIRSPIEYFHGHTNFYHEVHIVGSNSILGGPNVIYTAIAAICVTYININQVSRVKYWGRGGGGSSYAYEVITVVGRFV